MSLSDCLYEIATLVQQEILDTGTVIVNGQLSFRNSLRDNPYAGLCHRAALKVKELAPDLEMFLLSFECGGETLFSRSRHVVALVAAAEGEYIVDPTIQQYLPNAKAVYAPGEKYPLSMEGKVCRMKV